jgi:hypothetical protein
MFTATALAQSNPATAGTAPPDPSVMLFNPNAYYGRVASTTWGTTAVDPRAQDEGGFWMPVFVPLMMLALIAWALQRRYLKIRASASVT